MLGSAIDQALGLKAEAGGEAVVVADQDPPGGRQLEAGMGFLAKDGYIFVYQDVRGKFRVAIARIFSFASASWAALMKRRSPRAVYQLRLTRLAVLLAWPVAQVSMVERAGKLGVARFIRRELLFGLEGFLPRRFERGEFRLQRRNLLAQLRNLDRLEHRPRLDARPRVHARVAVEADVVDQFEEAAERDERHEPAFVLVIEATGVLLLALEKARAATEALGAALRVIPS